MKKNKYILFLLIMTILYIPNVYAYCPLGSHVTADLKSVLGILQIIGPLMIIGYTVVDVFKSIANGKFQEDNKMNAQRFLKRFVLVVLLFSIEPIVSIFGSITGIWDPGMSCDLNSTEGNGYTSPTQRANIGEPITGSASSSSSSSSGTSSDGSSSGTSSSGTATTLVGATNSEQAFNYLVNNKGWSKAAAAGAIGNMYQESCCGCADIRTDSADKYGNGGIVGWTDNSQVNLMTQFKNYASSVGDPWPGTSLKTQLDFLCIQLDSGVWTGSYDTPTYKGLNEHGYNVSHVSVAQFKSETNVRNAALEFLSFYEDCGYESSNVDYRIQMAESVYNTFAN